LTTLVDRSKLSLSAAAIALLGMLVISYLPALRGGFIWDDDDYVVNNWTLRSPSGLEAMWVHPTSLPQWYPMVHTTFWIEYHLWGPHPLGYKIDNLLLHFANSILLWIILRKLKIPGAWLAAAVFALHPMNVESAAWITERKNTLSLFFYLAALWAYLQGLGLTPSPSTPGEGGGEGNLELRTKNLELEPCPLPNPLPGYQAREQNGAWYWVSLILFVMALLSKTVACSLPVGILLILYYRNGKITRQQWLGMIPFFAIGAGLAYVTAHLEATQVGASGPEWNLSILERCLIAGHALWFYAWQLFWPTKLAFIYPKWQINTHSILQWIYPIGFLIALGLSWFYRKRIGRGAFVGIMFYAAAIFPALGFINVYPMRYSYVADHFQYLAGIGLIVLFVASMERYAEVMDPKDDLSALQKWIWHVISVDIPFVLPLMLLTYTQALGYQSKATLWGDTLIKNPNSWMVHLNMGHAYVEQGDGRSGMREYQEAEKLAPDVPDPHYNVGYRLDVNGDHAGALAEFKQAIARDPKFVMAYYGQGNALRQIGKLEDAVGAYTQAVAMQPSYTDAWYNMGFTDELLHHTAAAQAAYEQALQINPAYPGARENLAKIFVQQGNMNAGVEQYELAITADPSDAQCTVALLRLLVRLNRPGDFNAVYAYGTKNIPDLRQRLLVRDRKSQ
jgi:protein O-mannosyl-transferase